MKRYPAPAKVNLYLYVTGIRPDGRHELDTSFAYVDAADEIHIEKSEGLRVSCSTKHLEGEHNLVHRVLDGLRNQFGIHEGLHVHVEKRLPEQAGLGGGSSDAATAIMAANRIWDLHLSVPELIAFATPYGADIPCFLFGQASLGNGIGERLEPFPGNLPTGHLLLAYPGMGLSTAEVFRYFDAQSPAGTLTPHQAADTIRAVSRPLGHNDLEASARSLCPDVDRLLGRLRAHTNCAWMSGSGSACVAMLSSLEQAKALADELKLEGMASWTHVGQLLHQHPLSMEWGHIGA